MKVHQFYNKNQFLLKGEGKAIFQSYNSTIAVWEYSSQTLTLGIDWDYSNTTRKHLYLFLNEYVSYDVIGDLESQKNKRSYIQKLINDGIIKFDKNLY